MRQAYRLIKPNGLKALRHQGDRPEAENFAVLARKRCTIAATQQSLHSSEEFLEFKGLGQIVICPGLKGFQFIVQACSGCEKNYRKVRS